MLKKVMFAVVATAFVAATALPFQVAPAAAAADDLQGRRQGEIPERSEGPPRLQEGLQGGLESYAKGLKSHFAGYNCRRRGPRLAPFLCSAGTGRPYRMRPCVNI